MLTEMCINSKLSLKTLRGQSDSSAKVLRRASSQTKSTDDGHEVENEACSQNVSLTEDTIISIVERVSEIQIMITMLIVDIIDMSAKIDTT